MKNCWRYISSNLIFIVGSLSFFTALGQLAPKKVAEESYYMFPIKPGERNTLAGTMGELRSTHFHTGIDIRTEGRIGLPVYASADGYVSRVAVSNSGYGNAIYILHPNGHTTVYAHLDRINGKLASYIRTQQYESKSFEQNLMIKKGLFPVQKGDIIAYSGNSGSSGGPHLHYDIRDAYQNPLNPLNYGFEEILDHTPPLAEKIAVTTLNKNSRVSGQFGQMTYDVRRVGNNYVIDQPITAKGEIGIQLFAYDKLDNSRFRCGINTLEMDINGELVYAYDIQSFSFSEQRNILKHMSYENLHFTGTRYHKLYIDDGNKLNFYTTDKNNGRINVNVGQELLVTIKMTDTYENESMLTFKIIGKDFPESLYTYDNLKYDIDVIENTFVYKVPKEQTENGVVLNGTSTVPDYFINNTGIYLHDMRKEIPKVLQVDKSFKTYNFKDKVPHEMDYKYYDKHLDIYFPTNSLFDTLYLKTDYKLDTIAKQEYFEIGSSYVPLRKSIKVTLKPQQHYAKDQFAVYYIYDNGYKSFEGGSWEADKVSFWTRSFGKYSILQDSVPPTITPLTLNSNSLRFKIGDDLSGIKSFNCYVNNEWVLMNYDSKRALIWSEKLNDNKPFEGVVKLVVRDNQGNTTEYSNQLN